MSDSEVRVTTWDDARAAESRDYEIDHATLESPSSIVYWFECPWCHAKVKAYLWSLAGGGKRCSCGAIFGTLGRGYKRRAAGSSI